MAELDFSKIFGETATSKASFTDENYINGWGYLGSTPPPYQLFDYLQGLNDKKSKYLYDGLNENKNNLLAHNTDSSAHEDIRQMFNNVVTDVRLGSRVNFVIWNNSGFADTNGYIITSIYNYDNDVYPDGGYARPLQKYINNNWYTVQSI